MQHLKFYSVFVAETALKNLRKKQEKQNKMFQSKIEETKNNLNKESTLNGTVIQNFYDGTNIFITGGTGE